VTTRSTDLHVLLVAKSPIAGVAKTRLAAELGDRAAADLAAAALLDTITVVEAIAPADRRLLSLAGDLDEGERGTELLRRLADWHQVAQVGDSFAQRLGHAHHVAAQVWGDRALVVQIGMDTPHLRAPDLTELAASAIAGGPTGCALGPAYDGGWWGLATMGSGYADALSDVPMSRPDTGLLTARALQDAGGRVRSVHELRDVDTVEDARAVSESFPELEFSRNFRAHAVYEASR
jgi:glycosyltransferase A (GT-A) superfamily protein (DUF2064 family)